MEITKKQGQLFRYRKDSDFLLDELENSYIYFASNKELNDPFDASHMMLRLTDDPKEIEKLFDQLIEQAPDDLVKAYTRKLFENKLDDLRQYVISATERYVSSYGIACFTVTPIHIPLWANYANNHEGVCIQYDVECDPNFFENPRRVDYVDEFQTIDFLPVTNPQAASEIFYRKISLWKNEYEIRLVKSSTGKHSVNPKAVKSIILGLRTKEEYERRIIDIVKRKYKHATLYKTELMSNTYGLSFIPYDL